MSNDETYSGWTNRETWALWLHIINDESMYETTQDLAEAHLKVLKDEDVDSLLGRHVVEYWREYLLETQPHSNHSRLVLNEVGSWWRINHAEIGAAVREDLDN